MEDFGLGVHHLSLLLLLLLPLFCLSASVFLFILRSILAREREGRERRERREREERERRERGERDRRERGENATFRRDS